MNHHVIVKIAVGLGLALAAEAVADASMVEQARSTLQRMREVRQQRETTAAAPAQGTWGHFLKKPPEEERLLPPPDKVEVVKPKIRPTGTIRVGDQLRVVVDRGYYAVGDEISKGVRVRSISPDLLTVTVGGHAFDYPINR